MYYPSSLIPHFDQQHSACGANTKMNKKNLLKAESNMPQLEKNSVLLMGYTLKVQIKLSKAE